MTYQNLIFEKKDAIGYLTLNRPQKLNSFSKELMAELGEALDAIEADDDIRVVILTGAGPGVFCGVQYRSARGRARTLRPLRR